LIAVPTNCFVRQQQRDEIMTCFLLRRQLLSNFFRSQQLATRQATSLPPGSKTSRNSNLAANPITTELRNFRCVATRSAVISEVRHFSTGI